MSLSLCLSEKYLLKENKQTKASPVGLSRLWNILYNLHRAIRIFFNSAEKLKWFCFLVLNTPPSKSLYFREARGLSNEQFRRYKKASKNKTKWLGSYLTPACTEEQAVQAVLQLQNSFNWFQRKTGLMYMYSDLLPTQFSKQVQSDYVHRAINFITINFWHSILKNLYAKWKCLYLQRSVRGWSERTIE